MAQTQAPGGPNDTSKPSTSAQWRKLPHIYAGCPEEMVRARPARNPALVLPKMVAASQVHRGDQCLCRAHPDLDSTGPHNAGKVPETAQQPQLQFVTSRSACGSSYIPIATSKLRWRSPNSRPRN